jgi:magnesium transporter
MIVDCAHYRDGIRQNEGTMPLDEAARCGTGEDGSFVWLGLHEPDDAELADVQERFGLHELAVEDALGSHQRPKLEDYDDSYFIVLHTAHYHDETEEVHFGEIHVFVGRTYVIAVRHGAGSEMRTARQRIEARPELLRHGPAAVVWAIVDKVVDDYAPVVEGIDNDIEEVEESIFGNQQDSTQRIYFLKRESIRFHRAVAPLLGPLRAIEQGAFPGMDEQLRRFFRDVSDHARRVDEQVMGQRELLTSILEANLALLSVGQNAIVRSISAWAAIIAVPTFIASVYGMNFEHMPELGSKIGYPLALGVMLVSVVMLYRFFRRIDWL